MHNAVDPELETELHSSCGAPAAFFAVSICFGVSHEWHLDHAKPIEHIASGFVSGLHQAVVWFGPSLLAAWLEPVRTLSNAVCRNGVEQLLVKSLSMLSVTFTLHGDHRLEGRSGVCL